MHEFLGVKSRFNDWIKNRINKYDFIENTDFTTITKSLVTAQGNRYEEIDYKRNAEEYIKNNLHKLPKEWLKI